MIYDGRGLGGSEVKRFVQFTNFKKCPITACADPEICSQVQREATALRTYSSVVTHDHQLEIIP
jgi:hypothetical protein